VLKRQAKESNIRKGGRRKKKKFEADRRFVYFNFIIAH